MGFGSTAKVLLKCKLKYYRISECISLAPRLGGPESNSEISICKFLQGYTSAFAAAHKLLDNLLHLKANNM